MLKKFGISTKVEEELGDIVNFPRNQITVADKQHKQFFKNQKYKLEIGRKLKEISDTEAVLECCFQQSSEVMVSKYLHCRVIDCSLNADPVSLQHLQQLDQCLELTERVNSFFGEVQKIRESPFTLLLKALGGLKRSVVSQWPALLSSFNIQSELKKLKKAKKSEGEKIFSMEKFHKMKQGIDTTTTSTWEKMQCVVDMMRGVSTLLSRTNESKTMKALQAQENVLQAKKGAIFVQGPLRTDEMLGYTTDPSKVMIVDLLNKFDGPLQFSLFSPYLARYREEIKERVILFLQLSYGVGAVSSNVNDDRVRRG